MGLDSARPLYGWAHQATQTTPQAEMGMTGRIVVKRDVRRVNDQDISTYKATDTIGEEPLGILEVDGAFIVDLRNTSTPSISSDEILTMLLRRCCEDADRLMTPLFCRVPPDVRTTRFLEMFGFRSLADGRMERNYGSPIPLEAVY